jgi:Asp-tRNA(Asn)/Glu-tRNA(Gln) amidotransferase C subunit
MTEDAEEQRLRKKLRALEQMAQQLAAIDRDIKRREADVSKMENILSTVERMRADGVEDEEIERVVRLMEESRHRTMH